MQTQIQQGPIKSKSFLLAELVFLHRQSLQVYFLHKIKIKNEQTNMVVYKSVVVLSVLTLKSQPDHARTATEMSSFQCAMKT